MRDPYPYAIWVKSFERGAVTKRAATLGSFGKDGRAYVQYQTGEWAVVNREQLSKRHPLEVR